MLADCFPRRQFTAPSRVLGLSECLRTGKNVCDKCFGKLSADSQQTVVTLQESMVPVDFSLGDDGVGDDGDVGDACSSAAGEAGALSQDVGTAPPESAASSSREVPPPPIAPSHYSRARRSTDTDPKNLKGRLKRSAKHPPIECRGNSAPTEMDDEGWIKISNDDLSAAEGCPVNKAKTTSGRRRLTGGMQTFMLQCGFLLTSLNCTKESLCSWCMRYFSRWLPS